jgi:hypothetical protein
MLLYLLLVVVMTKNEWGIIVCIVVIKPIPSTMPGIECVHAEDFFALFNFDSKICVAAKVKYSSHSSLESAMSMPPVLGSKTKRRSRRSRQSDSCSLSDRCESP